MADRLVEFGVRGVVLFGLGTFHSLLEVAGQIALVEQGTSTADERGLSSVQALVVDLAASLYVGEQACLEGLVLTGKLSGRNIRGHQFAEKSSVHWSTL